MGEMMGNPEQPPRPGQTYFEMIRSIAVDPEILAAARRAEEKMGREPHFAAQAEVADETDKQ